MVYRDSCFCHFSNNMLSKGRIFVQMSMFCADVSITPPLTPRQHPSVFANKTTSLLVAVYVCKRLALNL